MDLNKIYNMDCLVGMKDIESNSVDMVLTDIPYLISRKTNFKSIKDFTKKEGETEYSCMNFGEWDKEFDVKAYISECCRILKPSRSIIVWSAWQQLKEVDDYIKEFLKNKSGSPRIGIWEKSNPSVFNMDKMAIQPYEFFIWNRKGSNWKFNNQRGKNVNQKGVETQIAERHHFRHGCIQGGHPTAKPVLIFEDLVKTYTDENDIVFDGLVGEGTTAVACINTNRNFICFELDKGHCDIANERIKVIK